MTFHHLFQFRKKTRSVIQGPNSLGLPFFMQEMQVGKGRYELCISRSRDNPVCRFPRPQKAGKCASSAGGTWLPEYGLLQAAVCLVILNRGLCRLSLEGGTQCAVSQKVSPALLCSVNWMV